MTELSDKFSAAHKTVSELVEDFQKHILTYRANPYSEAQARKDFIDPFFEALGWDVNHTHQRNPYEQEVLVERNVNTNSGQKRADYAFFLSPNFRDIRFFVEAKKPSLVLHDDIDSLFQTIRYGWSAGCPISAVTNFSEFIILDCRSKPDPATAILRVLLRKAFTELRDPNAFSEVYWLFSREAHISGSFERYCQELKKPRGATKQLALFKSADKPVDIAFLEDLERYRERFATMFKKADNSLDGEELTELTQRTLDRLIFLRFLEDKLIETKVSISQFGESGSAWGDFVSASRRLNGIYNGIIFKAHPTLDNAELDVDEDYFSEVCDELSDKNSPYLFNSIPIHILGSIYERFLGKIIVATPKRAHVEEKPEVRKAGGVYYTPEYIVHYIVEHTVGKKLTGKTPAQVKAMHFIDISCGSGSFLLGVYDYIIRYVSKWYNENPQVAKKDKCIRLQDDTWALSLHQKRELLVSCIYGVDIDRQAVEVTQLSLFLKLLEQETTASAYSHQLEFDETLLPSLSNNILCGNSLVGEAHNPRLALVEDEEKVNAFDYKAAFRNIYKSSNGFDGVLGNPPYIRIQTLTELHPATAHFVKDNYITGAKGSFDLYGVFIEKGLQLLNADGELGYIVPNKFFRTDYGWTLRKLATAKSAVRKIVDFGASQVFEDVSTYTCLLFLSSKPQKSFEFSVSEADSKILNEVVSRRLPAKAIGAESWTFVNPATAAAIAKLNSNSVTLLELPTSMNRGSSSGADDVFMISANVKWAPFLGPGA